MFEQPPTPPLPPGSYLFFFPSTKQKESALWLNGARTPRIKEAQPWPPILPAIPGQNQGVKPVLRLSFGVGVCSPTPTDPWLSPVLPQSGVNSGLVRAKDSITSLKEKTTRVNQHVQTLQVWGPLHSVNASSTSGVMFPFFSSSMHP